MIKWILPNIAFLIIVGLSFYAGEKPTLFQIVIIQNVLLISFKYLVIEEERK